MKKIGLYYSFKTHKTARIAAMISNTFVGYEVNHVDVDELNKEGLTLYDYMVVGVPTWFDGELPYYWDELVPAIEEIDFTGKKIALFGLGDQNGYPENFCDAIGILGTLLERQGAELVGQTSTDGYEFESSKAVRDGRFMGLALDQENQARMTGMRIDNWVMELKKVFL